MDDRDFIKLCEDALSQELKDPDFFKDLDLMRIRAQKEKKSPSLREEVKRVKKISAEDKNFNNSTGLIETGNEGCR